jgi:hypothetical protein
VNSGDYRGDRESGRRTGGRRQRGGDITTVAGSRRPVGGAREARHRRMRSSKEKEEGLKRISLGGHR